MVQKVGAEELRVACDCRNHDHAFVLGWDQGVEGWYVDMRLNSHLPWYRRVWRGVQYSLGWKRPGGGDWDTILLSEADVPAILGFLTKHPPLGNPNTVRSGTPSLNARDYPVLAKIWAGADAMFD